MVREATFSFGTKAETLQELQPRLTRSTIPEFMYFNVQEWVKDPEKILGKIRSRFGQDKLVVRSSSVSEDTEDSAMAGVHTSVVDVDTGQNGDLKDSIDSVIQSYKKSLSESNGLNQVLVQLMIRDVSMSGVVFTQEMNSGAPYYVINYDDQTGRTDTVTAGDEYSNRTLYVHREAVEELRSERFRALLHAVQEAEHIADYDCLDIEFAVDRGLGVHIFQCRKITTRPNWNRGITLKVNDAIQRLRMFVEASNKPVSGLYGSRSLFGQMPDWNPAEMIGTTPRPLSLSLYRLLITDRVWRIARRDMGYKEPRGVPLLVSMCGQPYISVRSSFNSFLPADLPANISEKLVNGWLDRLAGNAELHDKVEFEVVITAFFFNFDQTLESQIPGVLNEDEKQTFKSCLFRMTNNLLSGRVAPIESELQKLEQLEARRAELLSGPQACELSTIRALLEDCRGLGTLPFSVLARHAFIAQGLLRSMVDIGLLDEAEKSLFLRSVRTVAGDLVRDSERLGTGEITREEFISEYGHLRPGTYDILSLRYDQRADLLDGLLNRTFIPSEGAEFSLPLEKSAAIDEAIGLVGLDVSSGQLFSYMSSAIAAREYGKFLFSKNISDALELIRNWGEDHRLSREEISYLNIEDILDAEIVAQGRSSEQHLREVSQGRRHQHEVTLNLKLPYVICEPQDVSIVPQVINRPNFITRETVQERIVFLDGHEDGVADVAGKIVLIPSADPGFDWIFSFSIAGLITKYGGANSHMAIRCAEFGLPAAIGCGEQIFESILRFGSVEINCAEERINPIAAG